MLIRIRFQIGAQWLIIEGTKRAARPLLRGRGIGPPPFYREGTALTIAEIQTILNADFICGEEWRDHEVQTACGSDMMSDVLAFVKNQSVLLTGLVNPQVIRTAEMMDMVCVVFVRGKVPDSAMIALAQQREIALLSPPERMFTACGKLYAAGLGGGVKA